MKELVIIGNGFDLAHKLETSYIQFIISCLDSYLREASKKEDYTYKDENLTIYNTLGDKITGKRLLDEFDIFSRKTSTQVRIIIKNRFLGKLLRYQVSNRWVDIESFYYQNLLEVYNKISNTRASQRDIEVYKKELSTLNSNFDNIKLLLQDYLIQVSDSKINDSIRNPKVSNLIAEFKGDLNQKTQLYENEIYFLNFNYTPTIEIYANIKHCTTTVNYIHGNLKDENSDSLIFGYGDEKDLYYEKMERQNDNEFLKNFKSFGYFKTKDYQNLLAFLGDKFNVRILGHSCGLSDKILFNTIFEHKNCVKIYPYFHKKEDGSNDFYNKTIELSRHFKDKALMRERIVPFEECKPLIS